MSQIITGQAVIDEVARLGLVLNTFDDLVDHGRAVMSSPVAIIDELEDATGIDAANSTGETYNAAGYLSNPGTDSLIAGGTGTAIGNATGNGGLAAAFDGSVNNAAGSAVAASDPGTVGKDWGSGNDKTITKFVVKSPTDDNFGGASPITIKLQGSTDNFSSSVVDLHTDAAVVNTGTAVVHTVDTGITTSTAYRYHRVWINGGGSGAKVAEVEFYEAGTPPAIDARSASVALGITPATAFFVGKFSGADPDAVYVSADGGTAVWDEVTLTDHGDYGSGISVFSGLVTLTGGGAGGRLRFTRASGAECKLEAWGAVFGA